MVVTIIGVFMAVAHPFYQQHQKKVARSHMQTEILSITEKIQAFYALNNTYAGSSPLPANANYDFPEDKPLYRVQVTIPAAGTSFRVQATPLNRTLMAGDGVICMDQLMQRYWGSSCTLSPTSTWYGD